MEGAADLPHRVAAVDDDGRASLGDDAWPATRIDAVLGELFHVVGDTQHPVRMDAAEIGAHEALGEEGGVRIRHAATGEDRARDLAQPLRRQAPVIFALRVDCHERTGSGQSR
jgi:hypothetical protein